MRIKQEKETKRERKDIKVVGWNTKKLFEGRNVVIQPTNLVQTPGPQQRRVNEVRARSGPEHIHSTAAVFHSVQEGQKLVYYPVLICKIQKREMYSA